MFFATTKMTSHFHVHIAIARQIVGGEFDRSIRSLSDYLESLRDEMIESSDETIKSMTEQRSTGSDFFEIVPWKTTIAPQVLREGIQMFREPLLVRCIHGSVPIEAFTFVGIYNLALTYHLKFLHSEPERDEKNLHKAARLYQFAHEIFQNQGIQVHPVHLLSLVTNLANVYQILGEESNVKACMEHVLSIYMFIAYSNGGKGLATSLGRSLQCVFPLLFPKSDVAPAA